MAEAAIIQLLGPGVLAAGVTARAPAVDQLAGPGR